MNKVMQIEKIILLLAIAVTYSLVLYPSVVLALWGLQLAGADLHAGRAGGAVFYYPIAGYFSGFIVGLIFLLTMIIKEIRQKKHMKRNIFLNITYKSIIIIHITSIVFTQYLLLPSPMRVILQVVIVIFELVKAQLLLRLVVIRLIDHYRISMSSFYNTPYTRLGILSLFTIPLLSYITIITGRSLIITVAVWFT